MDFILKDFNLNFSKFLNHLLCKTKIVHTLINRLIYALVLNIKAMYPAPVKVRKKDFFSGETAKVPLRGSMKLPFYKNFLIQLAQHTIRIKSTTFRLTDTFWNYIRLGSHWSTAITGDCYKLRNVVMNRQMTNMTND